MIRINLLPDKDKQNFGSIKKQLLVFAALIVLSVVLLGFYNSSKRTELSRLSNEIELIKEDISKVEKIVKKVEVKGRERDGIATQLEAIRKLEKSKSGPVKLMDALASSIHKRVWLDSLKKKSNSLDVSGFSVENTDVSDFLEAMKMSNFFTNVKLKYTQQAKQSKTKRTVYKFAISATLQYD